MLDVTPRVFVSYARRDGEAFAADLAARIEANGVPVWRDRDGLRGGEGWWSQIERVLGEVEFLVVVLTPGAVESPIVRKEWHLARRKGVCIFPVIASDALLWKDMPLWMANGHCYDLKFQERKFFNDLHTRCDITRVPFMAADLPENHVPRPQLFDALVAMMLDENRGTPKAITTALRGAGGFGKTTLARAFCHDIRTRYLFYDAILWVALGEKPVDLTAKLDDLIYALTGARSGFRDKDAASAYLRELLEEKRALIVIDDVWRESDARPFLVGCTWLITTRIRETLPLNAEEIAVDEMANEEAVRVLAAGIPDHDGAALKLFAGRLGEWPLLLSLVNRVLVDRTRRRKQPFADAVASVNEKLDRQGLQAFDLASATERDDAVAKTLAVSFDALRWFGEEAVPRFESLAVFPEDVNVPVAVVGRLWNVPESTASEVCGQFFDLSLLLAHDLATRTIRLHDVIRAYLRQRVGAERERELHSRLVASYRESCDGRWHVLPDDGYVGDHLAHHLAESGDRETLDGLLGAEWRLAQLARVGSDRAFGADAETAISAALRAPRRDVSFVRAVYVCASIEASASRIPPEALEAMAMLGRHRQAMDSASFIHDPEKRSRAYRAIGAALARRGLSAEAAKAFDGAYEAIQAFDRDNPRSRELSALASALAVAGDLVRAKMIAAEGAETAKAAGYWWNDDVLLAAGALLDSGESAVAIELARSVAMAPNSQARGGRYVADLFRAVAVLERAGEDAAQVRELALEAYAEEADGVRNGALPGFGSEIVAALCDAGEIDRARETTLGWPMFGSSGKRSLATVGKALLARGDRETANDIADDLVEWVRRSSLTTATVDDWDPETASAFVDLMFILASLDRAEQASALAAAIAQDDMRAVALGTIASVGARTQWKGTGDVLAASLAASTLTDRLSKEDVRAMARLVIAFDRCGRRDESRRVLAEFRRARRDEKPPA